jgi:type IV pilus assembly protein PilM
MLYTPILAVHCGASHVACGRFSGGSRHPVLEWFGTTPVGSGEATEDDWLAAVDAGFRRLVRGEKPRGRCVVGLPGHLTFNHAFRVPAVSAWQRRKIVAFEQRQGMAAAVEDMVWSHALIAEDENGREMMLAVAKWRIIEELCARIKSAGWYPEAVLPSWLVLRNAVGGRPAPAGGALVLSIGTRSSLLVSAGARRSFVRVLAVGGAMITQKVAEDLQLDHAAAEALKVRGFESTATRPSGERERAAGQRAIDQFVRRLCAEIMRAPLSLSAADGAGRPAVLWLTGGGAQLPGLPAALAERLQLRVERLDLRSHISLGRGADGSGLERDDSSLVDLVGLAAFATTRARGEGNLLPRSFRWEMFARRRWPWLSAAALLAVAVLLAPIWRQQNIRNEVRRQILEADGSLSALRRIDTQNRSDLSLLAETNRRVIALGRLAKARSGWMVLLEDLQERFASVQDVWLDRLQLLQPEAGAQVAVATRPEASPPAGDPGWLKPVDATRIMIEGRLLDEDPNSAVESESARWRSPLQGAEASTAEFRVEELAPGDGNVPGPKAASLLAVLRASPLVAAVERERFAGNQPGIWCFEITLRLAPDALL